MKKQIYSIKPIFEERIWGGTGLTDYWDLDTDIIKVAEMYMVIAIPNHLDCMVTEADLPLSEFYETNKEELFNCEEQFLPVRLVAGSSLKPLSVQVHPTEEYALKHENMYSKPESELILGDEEGEMYLGHFAKTKEEFTELAMNKQWDKLLRKVKIKGGDFIHIPSGTLHGGGGGNGRLVAFSRNGDVTYRLYDYERVDADGKERPLHVQDVINNVIVPDDQKGPAQIVKRVDGDALCSDLLDEPGLYTCGRIELDGKYSYNRDEFYFIACIGGAGQIEGVGIKAGDTKFVPCGYGDVHLEGAMDLVYISYRK